MRAAADRSAVSVEYDALVVQSTGEDWNKVRLSLSTAEPTRASGPPPVEPWFVDVYVPPPPVAVGAPVTRAMTAAPMAMADAVPGSPAEPGAAGAENVAEMRKALEDLSAGAAVNDSPASAGPAAGRRRAAAARPGTLTTRPAARA